jgi:microcystin-dependent protein
MSEPFMAEIKIVPFAQNVQGWAKCDGQFMPINQNQALFSLLGTMYGGNGQTTFALPNLKGRVPIHFGNGHTLGEAAGASAVTITQTTMPQHLHFLMANTGTANTNQPANAVLAGSNLSRLYGAAANLTPMAPSAVTNVGGSQAHTNMMPYLVLNFLIALQGIFPSQN